MSIEYFGDNLESRVICYISPASGAMPLLQSALLVVVINAIGLKARYGEMFAFLFSTFLALRSHI